MRMVASRKILDRFDFEVTVNGTNIIEERIKIILRPKPRLLPTVAWYWLLKNLIHLERHKKGR